MQTTKCLLTLKECILYNDKDLCLHFGRECVSDQQREPHKYFIITLFLVYVHHSWKSQLSLLNNC